MRFRRSEKAIMKKRKQLRYFALNKINIILNPEQMAHICGIVDGLDWCLGKINLTKEGNREAIPKRKIQK